MTISRLGRAEVGVQTISGFSQGSLLTVENSLVCHHKRQAHDVSQQSRQKPANIFGTTTLHVVLEKVTDETKRDQE